MVTRNNTMLTDFYELTMINGYSKCGMQDRIAVFDLFFRGNDEISYAVAAGLEQAIEFIQNIEFSDEDIDYLKSLNVFDEDFFNKLRNLNFTGDIYAVKEGTVVFPYEPIITVVAPIFEAQFIETYLLTIINHQTLIATKASKMSNNTTGAILEFGLRRAQGGDAGIYGSRACMIGGCVATSNVLAGKMFNIPVSGTHAHSWVMSFKDEITAFREYAKLYPDNCVLLVDTYDTINSGIPNAIKVMKELKASGHKPKAIRLDSGDLAYLSRNARMMLDKEGLNEVKIIAGNDIDENVLIS
jgi:nicotinate phosphoribosyltransferase